MLLAPQGSKNSTNCFATVCVCSIINNQKCSSFHQQMLDLINSWNQYSSYNTHKIFVQPVFNKFKLCLFLKVFSWHFCHLIYYSLMICSHFNQQDSHPCCKRYTSQHTLPNAKNMQTKVLKRNKHYSCCYFIH